MRSRLEAVAVLCAALALGAAAAHAEEASGYAGAYEKARRMTLEFPQQVQSFIVEEATRQPGMTGQARILRRGDRIRIEASFPPPSGMPGGGFRTVSIYDGAKLWAVDPFIGAVEQDVSKWQSYPAEFFGWELLGPDAKITGTEKIVERNCFVVELGPSALHVPYRRVWLDTGSLALMKAEWSQADPDGPARMVLMASVFKKIDRNWEMPYEIRIWKDDVMWYASSIRTIGVNIKFSSDLLDPQKAAQQIKKNPKKK